MKFSITNYDSKKIIIFLLITLQLFGLGVFLSSYTSLFVVGESYRIFLGILIQLSAIILGWISFFVIWKFFDYRWFRKKWVIVFMAVSTIAVILYLVLFGEAKGGAFRWFSIGFATIQPSEIVKPVSVIVSAYFLYMSEKKNDRKYLAYFSMYLFAILVVLYKQVDLGTLIIIIFSLWLLFICVRSLSTLTKIMYTAIMIIMLSGVVFFSPHALKRFNSTYKLWTGNLTEIDRRGDLYHQTNNLKALSYGGVYGSGFTHSAQKQNKNLPEISTDSVFAFLGEEFGFIGTTTVILLFLVLSFLFTNIARVTKDRMGMFIVVGLTSLITSQVFFHILVTLGAPTSGIPLVFFSKGGSIILFTMMSIGIILNISSKSARIKRLEG